MPGLQRLDPLITAAIQGRKLIKPDVLFENAQGSLIPHSQWPKCGTDTSMTQFELHMTHLQQCCRRVDTCEGGCRCACFMTASVHGPGPVRSSTSECASSENSLSACRLMCSQTSLSAGCSGAAAKVHCNTFTPNTTPAHVCCIIWREYL